MSNELSESRTQFDQWEGGGWEINIVIDLLLKL